MRKLKRWGNIVFVERGENKMCILCNYFCTRTSIWEIGKRGAVTKQGNGDMFMVQEVCAGNESQRLEEHE